MRKRRLAFIGPAIVVALLVATLAHNPVLALMTARHIDNKESLGEGDNDPSWAPDGTGYAFSHEQAGDFDIYIANADGTARANITNTPDTDEMVRSGPRTAPASPSAPAATGSSTCTS